MSYVTELASGATVLDIADKELYSLRTLLNANKLLAINTTGTGYVAKAQADFVSTSQGVTHAGKVLIVGDDGDVTLGLTSTVGVGSVIFTAGSTVPTGYLLCNGSAISRTDYADLFAVIGTTYGAGDGSTTFKIPNLIDKFIEGSATAGTNKAAGLPNITGSPIGVQGLGDCGFFNGGGGGAFISTKTSSHSVNSTNSVTTKNLAFDASHSNSIYGGSTTVQPPAITMLPLIKY